MIRKDIVKEIILVNQNRNLDQVLPRETLIPLNTGKIISITGIRRCGKTHLLLSLIKQLCSGGSEKEFILFINFEDERLSLKSDELDIIIQAYRELFPENDLGNVYFFFDEIQNVSGWEKFVRRVYDSISKNIFITGSNAKMLGTDISTSLRGRSINIELFPLSFNEYLLFNNLDKQYHSPSNRANILNALKKYLINGGFPEVINSQYAQNILQEYYYVMLYKDLIERYNISNVSALKYFLDRIVINTGKPSSIRKIYNELKSSGHAVSKDSLYQFAEHAESIYFSFHLSRFDYSFIKRSQAEKKIYFIDNGLINALTYHFSENTGSLLENAVFLYLRRLHPHKVFFYKQHHECDFLIMDKDKPSEIIQVAYKLDDQNTLDRELKGIESASKYFGLTKGTIITFEEERDIIMDNIKVSVIPAYKYFLTDNQPDEKYKQTVA